jgi:signal transduction histidine kinase
VVQDLAGTAFSLTAVSRDTRLPDDVRADLEGAGHSLRTSLRSLRSLLVSIHPPDLDAHGLTAALTDLTAPAATAGIEASVSVSDVDEMPDETVALVWRVAQEAVRNAIRHAHATRLDVRVQRSDGHVVLDVSDDGDGFDPDAERDPSSFGLRGLTSLVHDAGGRLVVRSSRGQGTEVRMEVALR